MFVEVRGMGVRVRTCLCVCVCVYGCHLAFVLLTFLLGGLLTPPYGLLPPPPSLFGSCLQAPLQAKRDCIQGGSEGSPFAVWAPSTDGLASDTANQRTARLGNPNLQVSDANSHY